MALSIIAGIGRRSWVNQYSIPRREPPNASRRDAPTESVRLAPTHSTASGYQARFKTERVDTRIVAAKSFLPEREPLAARLTMPHHQQNAESGTAIWRAGIH